MDTGTTALPSGTAETSFGMSTVPAGTMTMPTCMEEMADGMAVR